MRRITLFSLSGALLLITSILILRTGDKERRAQRERRLYEKSLLAMLDTSELKLAAEKRFAAKGKKLKLGFPQQQALQDFFLTLDPALGRVPKERLLTAWKYGNSLAHSKTDPLSNVVSWTNVPSDMGGRMRAVQWDPGDPLEKKAWAGSVTGGLWFNNDVTNPSSPWIAVDDFWSGLSVACIAFDPQNSQVMYVGTGEAPTAIITYRESCGLGVGILKSTDGGLTWNLLPSTAQFAFVNDILVRNENGNSVVYAGVVSGKYMGAAHASMPSDGLYRSADGGVSWTQVLPNITGETKAWPVSDIDMNSNGRIFVGTSRNLDGKGGASILYSDAGTAGTWTVFDNYLLSIPAQPDFYLPGRVMVACAPSNPSTVYAIISAGNIQGWEVYNGLYFLRSTNQGVSWTAMSIPPDYNNRNWANLAWHAFTIGVDQNNPSTVWIGGLDLNRSTNGGQSWTKMTDWALMYQGGGPDYVHADLHAVVYKPGSSQEILFGTDGGIFYTASGGTASPVFQEMSQNLSTLQFYTCALTPQPGSDMMAGGLQDNGCLWYTGNDLSLNDMVSGGDGAYCFFDQDDPGLLITSIYYNTYYIFNNGSFLNYVDAYQSGYFINPADYDYRFNTLYANAGPMYGSGSQDRLLRIQDIDGMANGQFLNLGTATTVPFTHIKVSPNSTLNNIRVFAGSMSGRLFRISNAQATPQVTEIGSPSFPTATISCVAVGGSDDTLLVSFSNYGVASVWRTFDGGQNWQNAEGNLPDMPVRWAVFHPQNRQQVLLATELGVWSTSNLFSGNVWWTPASQGLANVRVDMLQLRNSDKRVSAATHGRGLFLGTYLLDPASGLQEQPGSNQQITLRPNPSSGLVTLDNPFSGDIELSISSLSGAILHREKRPNAIAGPLSVDLTRLPPGTCLLTLRHGPHQRSSKLLLCP
ncbi:MAG TPA: hypothetical protein P5531_06955 [Bacteroidales bacterium]|nr:hypothetical protein [Bacteroidales bacterium]HSA44501.1 hypothetical protein [Bacteroidales bacterium]